MDYEQIQKELKEQGYSVLKGGVNKEDLEILSSYCDTIASTYSEKEVYNRVHMKADISEARKGYACMFNTLVGPILNNNLLSEGTTLHKYFESYNKILCDFVGEEMTPVSKRTMINCQTYSSGSKEVHDHYDGFFSEYEHGESQYGTTFKLKSGLIPRLVMVIVTYNDNDGFGTYIREHGSEERIQVKNEAGDIIIFDNVKFRHGVPTLENRRQMIGFRNFDYCPLQFSDKPKEGFEFMEDAYNPGYVKEISIYDAHNFLVEDLVRWQNSFKEKIQQEPAF